MRRPIALHLIGFAWLAMSCTGNQGAPPPALVQVVDNRGPATVGPSIQAGADIQELNALLLGAGAECPAPCWSQPSDPAVAYLAVVATAPCEDRDLTTSVSGSRLTLTISWKSVDCRGVEAASTLQYSLLSAPRKLLPAGRIAVAVRYVGQTAHPGPQPGDTVLDLSPPPAPDAERMAVAAAIAAARAGAGVGAGGPRDVRLVSLYRLHCTAGVDSYVVSLMRTAGGPTFTGQYVGGAQVTPQLGCPTP